jgi:hypothetical protein
MSRAHGNEARVWQQLTDLFKPMASFARSLLITEEVDCGKTKHHSK